MKLRVYRKTVRLPVCLRPPLKILLTLIVKETGYVSQGCCNGSSSSSRTKKKKNWTGFCKTGFYTCASAFSSEARSLHRPAEPDGSGPPSRQTHTPARDAANDSQIKAFHREFVCSSPARRTVLCNAALLKLKSTLAQLRH